MVNSPAQTLGCHDSSFGTVANGRRDGPPSATKAALQAKKAAGAKLGNTANSDQAGLAGRAAQMRAADGEIVLAKSG